MPPLILHNVPDEELYIGADGVQRPYAMLFPGTDGSATSSRTRRTAPETGSFGKSTRRSRSRTSTPAAKREDPTIVAADAIFSSFIASRATMQSESPQRKSSIPPAASQPGALATIDTSISPREIHKEPTEVIFRGFKSSHQYAAIHEYERIAGRICEDYSRDAPPEQRRYKSDLRDPAALRRRPLTPEERAKANKFAGGDNWIKVTFESAEAAEAAIVSSPQVILGHLVYAELYRGVPPTSDEPIPANRPTTPQPTRDSQSAQVTEASASRIGSRNNRAPSSALPKHFTTPTMSKVSRSKYSLSPPESHSSSHTLDSGTLSTATVSTATVRGQSNQVKEQEDIFCRKIPTAKKAQLLPAEQALLPQKSYSQRIVSRIPLIGWLSSDIIGTTLPRTEAGDFDWIRASLYWKLIYWVDTWTNWFGIVNGDKED